MLRSSASRSTVYTACAGSEGFNKDEAQASTQKVEVQSAKPRSKLRPPGSGDNGMSPMFLQQTWALLASHVAAWSARTGQRDDSLTISPSSSSQDTQHDTIV